MESNKILIVEDDKSILHLLELHLKESGYNTESVDSGIEAINKLHGSSYTLVILDLSLPDIDGLQVCTRLRADNIDVPIIILTARGSEIDRVMGLELGADDYITKPFSIKELIARIRALLRRLNNSGEKLEDTISYHDLEANFTKRVVKLRGVEINLTVKEFELLSLFPHNLGRTFTRSELLDRVWGYNFEGYDHTVNTHINRLRKKIERDVESPEYLITVWGVGYKFSEVLH